MAPALALTGVSKNFGGKPALSAVDLQISAGQVLGLVGQNGSGKSTLIKILAGVHTADAGSASIAGSPLPLGNAKAAKHAGLRFVHQDLGLVPTMTGVENLGLGRGYISGRSGRILWKQERRAAAEAVERLGFSINVTVPVGSLPLTERAILAIARAVDGSDATGCVLVLDEPTAALSPREAARLFEAIHGLRDTGHAVLFVSHHLDEVLGECNQVTVLRNGVQVGTHACAGMKRAELAELVVGSAVDEVGSAAGSTMAGSGGAARLSVRNLAAGVVEPISFDVAPGEVLGVTGLSGSGRETIASALIGLVERSGEVRCGGTVIAAGNPRQAWSAGMAYLPGDRATFGAVPELSVRENMALGDLRANRRALRLDKRAERAETTRWLDRLGVRPRDSEAVMGTLSGGNQQKVLAARALRCNPRVLVADEPTAGMDLGARADLHAALEEALAEGLAIVLVSTDSSELARLARRVLVMHAGRIALVMDSAERLDEAQIDHAQLTAGSVTKEFSGESTYTGVDLGRCDQDRDPRTTA